MNKIIRLCLIFCLLFMVVLVMSCNHNVKLSSQSEITFLPTPTPPIFSSNTIQANKPDSTEKPNEEKLFIASETCKKIKNRENRLLCDTMVKVNNLDEDATIDLLRNSKHFSFKFKIVDS